VLLIGGGSARATIGTWRPIQTATPAGLRDGHATAYDAATTGAP